MEAVINVVILNEADLSAMTEIVARMCQVWKDVEAEGKGSRDGKSECGAKSTIAGRNLAITLRRQ